MINAYNQLLLGEKLGEGLPVGALWQKWGINIEPTLDNLIYGNTYVMNIGHSRDADAGRRGRWRQERCLPVMDNDDTTARVVGFTGCGGQRSCAWECFMIGAVDCAVHGSKLR